MAVATLVGRICAPRERRRASPMAPGFRPSFRPRRARQTLSLWQYLELHFSADRGKSEGCRQNETHAGVWAAPPSGPP
ncbi:MAG: hypothetical protein ABR970_21735, partial [Roseiarcus sp.]